MNVIDRITIDPSVLVGKPVIRGTRIAVELLAIRAVPEANVTASVVRPGSVEYVIGQRLEFPLPYSSTFIPDKSRLAKYSIAG